MKTQFNKKTFGDSYYYTTNNGNPIVTIHYNPRYNEYVPYPKCNDNALIESCIRDFFNR